MSGSGRPGRLLKAPGNRRRRGMAVTRGRKPSSYRTRLTGRLMRFKGARRKTAGPPPIFSNCALAICHRALRAELPVGVDHRLAVGPRLGEPFCGEALADLLQATLQGLARRQYFQTVSGELLTVPLVLILRPPPAARFGGGGNLEQRILRGLVEPIKGRLVHQGDVLREPRLRVVEIGHGLPCLAVVAGGDRSHEGVDQAGGKRLLQVGRLDRHRIGADDLGDALGSRVVHPPGEPPHIRDGVDLLLRVDALGRPGHREQHHQALRGEFAFDRRLRRRPQFARLVVARGQERDHVDAEHGIFVVVHCNQDVARFGLADPHRALDRSRREQRRVGINLDRELAAGHIPDVLGEGGEVLAVKVVSGVGGRETPLDLCAGRRGGERERDSGCDRRESYNWHGPRAPRAEFAKLPPAPSYRRLQRHWNVKNPQKARLTRGRVSAQGDGNGTLRLGRMRPYKAGKYMRRRTACKPTAAGIFGSRHATVYRTVRPRAYADASKRPYPGTVPCRPRASRIAHSVTWLLVSTGLLSSCSSTSTSSSTRKSVQLMKMACTSGRSTRRTS